MSYQPLTPIEQKRKTYYSIALVAAIVCTCVMGIFLLPLIWCIPMCKQINKSIRNMPLLYAGYNSIDKI